MGEISLERFASILSTIGGFNSAKGLSENNTNDIVIGVITMNAKIKELLACNLK